LWTSCPCHYNAYVASRPTVNVSSIVDLPAVIQSMAGSRRTGVLQVRSGSEERRLHFRSGQLVACGGTPRGLLSRAMCWSRMVTPAMVSDAVAALGGDPTAAQLANHLRARGELQPDALLEAMALCADEDIATVLSWPAPSFDIMPEAPADAWAEFQSQCGLVLSAPALLLEALRRQDERAQLGELVPDTWDVLRRETSSAGASGEDQELILERCSAAATCRDLLAHPLLPPHRAMRALVDLRRAGLLRVVTAAELAALGEQAREQNRLTDAYGILGRAVSLGHDGARIREHLANLAEQLGDRAAAAAHCLAAVPFLQSPQLMIQALKFALRLGSEPEGPLTQLVALNLTVGDDRATLEALLALVRLYENRGDRTRAIEALGEAQQLGADKVVTGKMMARLAAAAGDVAQAALQYEQAARLATERGRGDEAIEAWLSLIQLKPERLEPVRACAELLVAAKRSDEAAQILREALPRATAAPEEVQLAAWELLARLAPGDGAAHDWIAKTYAKRRDRDGATRQLRLIAERQEKEGDDLALVDTLERIVVLGGEDVELLGRLGDAHDHLGRSAAAVDAWCRAVDLATEAGRLDAAKAVLTHALENVPASAPLRARAAETALREGDRETALIELRRAADLASGSGDPIQAKELLTRLCGLRADDIVARLRLVELLREQGDPDEVAAVEDALRLAIRRADFGSAVELARRRVQVVEADRRNQIRAELVELLRRSGDSAGERAAARELLDSLLEAGEVEAAIELLSRQFAAHPRDPDLALQLAEVSAGVGDERLAARCYRHAVQLLQAEGRIDDARSALDQLLTVSDDDLLILAARKRLDSGDAVEWEQLRTALEHDQRKGMVDKLGSEMVRR
jgi:tetratricopeptide (TPR) repeat protein